MTEQEKLESLVKHIRNVQENCLTVGTKIIKLGDIDFGRKLIANGFIHDASKFHGFEWEHLFNGNQDKESMALAIKQHNHSNMHHPEYWGSIHYMPKLYVAELLCDWKARSTEFGSSLFDWIQKEAVFKFGFGEGDRVYNQIIYFYNLVCDKPFESNLIAVK